MGKRKTRAHTNCPQPFQNHSGQLKVSARCRRNRSLLLESAACRELTGLNKEKRKRRRTRLGSYSRSLDRLPQDRMRGPASRGCLRSGIRKGVHRDKQTRFLSARRRRANTNDPNPPIAVPIRGLTADRAEGIATCEKD